MLASKFFRHLRTLGVTLRLDNHNQLYQTSTDRFNIQYGAGGSTHFYLKEEICREYAVSLYKQLQSNSGAHSSIESVKAKFETNHQYNEWVYVVRSESCDRQKVRVEKDFFKASPKRDNEVTPAGTSWGPFG
jgi:hypothetical protein